MAKISYVGRSVTPEEYLGLREAVGWPPVEVALAARGLRYDLFSVVVDIDGEIVGCGRVLGDGVLHFYLEDVIVHPRVQRRKIGSRIMEMILSWLGANARPGARVTLLAAPGTAAFFSRFGFETRPADSPALDLADPRRLHAGNA